MRTGYVYKLVSNDILVKDFYIGSTDNMRIRKSKHKHHCNNEVGKSYNLRVYQHIRANGGWQNWDLIEVEMLEYDRKPELYARERYHLELLGATLNSLVPNRTQAEYREDNKEHIKQQQAEWYQNNAEHIKQQKKQYHEDNAEQIKQRHKQYYQNNTEQIKQQQAEYRIDNVEHIKQRDKQKHICPCGGKYTQANKAQHLKTAKHQRHVAII